MECDTKVFVFLVVIEIFVSQVNAYTHKHKTFKNVATFT